MTAGSATPLVEGAPETRAAPQPPPDASPPGSLPPRRLRTPPIDIFETPAGLVLRADLPGVTSETLELQVQDNRLTLFGRVALDLPPEERLVHQEYYVGDFLRSFILSDDVDHDRITARLSDGVLEVTLPRAERSAPRTIQVKTE